MERPRVYEMLDTYLPVVVQWESTGKGGKGMVVTTLSKKHQMTVPMEIVKMLGLVAGMRFNQWVEGGRIIIEPVPDIMESYGVFKKSADMPQLSMREEKEAIELGIAMDALRIRSKH